MCRRRGLNLGRDTIRARHSSNKKRAKTQHPSTSPANMRSILRRIHRIHRHVSRAHPIARLQRLQQDPAHLLGLTRDLRENS